MQGRGAENLKHLEAPVVVPHTRKLFGPNLGLKQAQKQIQQYSINHYVLWTAIPEGFPSDCDIFMAHMPVKAP